jgi:hypothetical protein
VVGGKATIAKVSSLRSSLQDLAAKFYQDVLAAIRGASLEELLREEAGGGRAPRPSRAPRVPAARAPAARPSARKAGRLARRSQADIDKTLALVVTALKATKGKGLRSEQIQKALDLDKRELPRVLRTGVAKKALRSKGQKRATIYFAA